VVNLLLAPICPPNSPSRVFDLFSETPCFSLCRMLMVFVAVECSACVEHICARFDGFIVFRLFF
jgi:hypothetical protein